MAVTADVAKREAGARGPKKVNGAIQRMTRPTHIGEDYAPPPRRAPEFRRPYILESASFANRLEVDLHYADNELQIIDAQIAALNTRRDDLVLIRDAALTGLGVVQRVHEHPAAPPPAEPEDEERTSSDD